jgi:hypothetical protein
MTIVSVKFIFKYINEYGDKCLNTMEELFDFTDYLRIYSCDMKMSLEEIYMKYSFKSDRAKRIVARLQEELKRNKHSKYEFECFMKTELNTPDEFNKYFSDIIEYYGSTYSDVLDKKLSFTIREMENSINKFEKSHSEKKNLNNRISILVGCLTAVILV